MYLVCASICKNFSAKWNSNFNDIRTDYEQYLQSWLKRKKNFDISAIFIKCFYFVYSWVLICIIFCWLYFEEFYFIIILSVLHVRLHIQQINGVVARHIDWCWCCDDVMMTFTVVTMTCDGRTLSRATPVQSSPWEQTPHFRRCQSRAERPPTVPDIARWHLTPWRVPVLRGWRRSVIVTALIISVNRILITYKKRWNKTWNTRINKRTTKNSQ